MVVNQLGQASFAHHNSLRLHWDDPALARVYRNPLLVVGMRQRSFNTLTNREQSYTCLLPLN